VEYVVALYLSEKAHFELTDDAWLHLQAGRKARGSLSLGSWYRKAAGSTVWMERLQSWLEKARAKLKIDKERMLALLSKPTSEQAAEPDRLHRRGFSYTFSI